MRPQNPFNILYIHGDGAGRFVEPHGYAVPTPNLMRLASQGVMFRNAFCTAPTCSPSRASFYCGNMPSSNRMHGLTNRGWWFGDESTTLHDYLQKAGYQTILASKDDFVQFKWDRRIEIHIGGSRAEHDLAKDVIAFFESDAAKAQPFFMSAGVGAPKGRGQKPMAYKAQPVDRDRVRPPLCYPDTPESREDWAQQIDATRLMDAFIGQVLDGLDKSGLADRTLVVATTDHGPGMPYMKGYPSDAGLGTFFMMRGPGGFTGGKSLDPLISHIDFFPTVCDIVGLPIPEWVEGKSLVPLVNGKVDRLHDEVFAETSYHYTYCPSRSVRTERYRYVRWHHQHAPSIMTTSDPGPIKEMFLADGAADRSVPPEALYDLWYDPTEQDNRIDDPAYAKVADDLRKRVEEQIRRVRDPIGTEGFVPLVPGTWCPDRCDVKRTRKHLRLDPDAWNALMRRELREGGSANPPTPDVPIPTEAIKLSPRPQRATP